MQNLLLFLLLFFTLNLSISTKANNTNPDSKAVKGLVLNIISDQKSQLIDGEKQRQQLIEIQLSDGRKIETINNIADNLAYKVILKKGDRILLTEEDDTFFVEGYEREWVCWALISLFLVLVVLIGQRKGVFAILSLSIKLCILIFALIPLIKSGFSPILGASLISILSTFLTIVFVSGFNNKSLSACLGTIGGIIVSGLIGAFFVSQAHLSGLMEQETSALYAQFPAIKITELISAGVLIGALGACMDVAISIASALNELKEAAPNMQFKDLLKSGMNIGQDIMGTMINTLILAYLGSSLPIVILITQIQATYLFNMELMVKELILSIVGSIGLVLTIPFTALISSYLYTKYNRPLAK